MTFSQKQNSEPPLVSVIICAYQRPHLLVQALDSVYQQTYAHIEIVLVDDASQPPLAQTVASSIAACPHSLQLLRLEDNRGPGVAREVGRRHCKGEFIQYLDSDDVLLPNKLELQVNALLENTACDLSYGKTVVFNGEKPPITARSDLAHYLRTSEQHTRLLPALLDGRLWATSTPLYRANMLHKVGPWLPTRVCEDIEYEFRVAVYARAVHYTPETIVLIREHKDRTVNTGRHVAGLNDHITCYCSVVRLFGANQVVINYDKHPLFANNLFFLARKAAASGDEKSMTVLLEGFTKVQKLTKTRTLSASLFAFFARIFGARLAGRIADGIERQRVS